MKLVAALVAFGAGILIGVVAGIYSVYWQKPAVDVRQGPVHSV